MSAPPDSRRPVSLRPDVVVEPLVDRWYAWSHLLSPATAARNIARRHLPIMTSYLAAPAVHQRSARTPALAGGPFMDLDGDRSADVEALIEATRRRAARLLELDAAVDALQDLLANADPGAPLEQLYPLVPEPLKGYVELVYDLRDNASFRLIEGLLYRSDYAAPDGQSLALSPLRADRRPFVLSTPRLDTDDRIVLPVAFHHPGVDVMFSTTRSPRPFGEIADALELTPGAAALLAPYFTAAPATAAPRESVRKKPGIRYLGHACVLAETDQGSVLVDPLLPPAFPGAGPRLADSDLPDHIDHVLITHGHQDHLVLETLLRLRTRIGTIVVPRSDSGSLQDPSLRLALEAAGFPRVIELGELQELETPAGRIMAVPFFGEHGDLAIAAKSAWRLEADGKVVLFAADTSTVDPEAYAHVRRAIGEVDVLFLGMECEGAPLTWLYGPLFTSAPDREAAARRRLNGNDDLGAVALAEALGCGRAYVYAMGHEPWVWYLTTTTFNETAVPVRAAERFVTACRARGIEARRLHGSCDLPW